MVFRLTGDDTQIYLTKDTRDEVLVLIDEYIRWYNHERIKQSLGWMSPYNTVKAREWLHDHLQENVRSPIRRSSTNSKHAT